MAPELEAIGSQLNSTWIRDYLHIPFSRRPILTERMPDLFISDAEVDTLISFVNLILVNDELDSLAGQNIDAGHIEQGKVLFEHYCVVCHGMEGAGDGFNSYNLETRPRDLSEHSFQKSLDDRRLEDIIKFGGTFRGGTPLMPAWGSLLNDKELNRVVKYIRTFD